MTIYRLDPGVQHYAWGDPEFIPRLLGIGNEERRPFAELWLGTHPDLPTWAVRDGEHVLLETLTGKLPYLMKVLAAREPLSLQVHPSEEQARAGFARENALGIPLDAPERNYRDAHAKPELLCALTTFYALCGFRNDLPADERASLKTLYERRMTMPQEDVDALLAPKIASIREDAGRYGKEDREYWLLRCHETFSKDGHYDRGLLSIELLNLVRLEPGEALYLDAGTLHAYLEGAGVEIMAASNNVIRGGLTEKHVDVAELLRIVVCQASEPWRIRAAAAGENEWAYETPAKEFELRRIEGEHQESSGHGPQILLVTEGEGTIGPHPARRGQSFCALAAAAYTVRGAATVYKAMEPQ